MFEDLDKIWIGLLSGLVVPFVGYAVLLQILEYLGSSSMMQDTIFNFDFRPRTLALLAIALNLLTLRYFKHRGGEQTIRGIVFATLIYAGCWFYYYGANLGS